VEINLLLQRIDSGYQSGLEDICSSLFVDEFKLYGFTKSNNSSNKEYEKQANKTRMFVNYNDKRDW